MRGKLAKMLRAFAKQHHKEAPIAQDPKRGNMKYPDLCRRSMYQELKRVYRRG